MQQPSPEWRNKSIDYLEPKRECSSGWQQIIFFPFKVILHVTLLLCYIYFEKIAVVFELEGSVNHFDVCSILSYATFHFSVTLCKINMGTAFGLLLPTKYLYTCKYKAPCL